MYWMAYWPILPYCTLMQLWLVFFFYLLLNFELWPILYFEWCCTCMTYPVHNLVHIGVDTFVYSWGDNSAAAPKILFIIPPRPNNLIISSKSLRFFYISVIKWYKIQYKRPNLFSSSIVNQDILPTLSSFCLYLKLLPLHKHTVNFADFNWI